MQGESSSAQVGELIGFSKEGALIQCGQGVLEVLEMQKPGGKRINAIACLQTHSEASAAVRFHKE